MDRPTLTLTLLAIFSLNLLLIFFNHVPSKPPRISYYHWANEFKLDQSQLTNFPTHQLYIKFLDIGFRKQLILNRTQFKDTPPKNHIPVVFLDNEALKQTPAERLLQTILETIPSDHYTSLQMDCDWTLSTRDKYFALLQQLSQEYEQLSATIRLHQVKYFNKTGVPPVKTGVLMYYNMSEVRDINTNNYVLDNEVGRRYLDNFTQYPIDLDLALPLYQQTRVIRQHKLVLLLPGVSLDNDKVEKIDSISSAQRYRVTSAHYWQGEYLYKDDVLILDNIDLNALKSAVHDLSPVINPKEVIFYKFRDARRFSHETLQTLVQPFH